MLFYLTTLNLAKYLNETDSILEDETDCTTVVAMVAWKHCDFLCPSYILNGMNNTLYNMYCIIQKNSGSPVTKKYKTEDISLKKFIVTRFHDFKMLDSNMVINRVQELRLILYEIHVDGMNLSKFFQIVYVIKNCHHRGSISRTTLSLSIKNQGLDNQAVN